MVCLATLLVGGCAGASSSGPQVDVPRVDPPPRSGLVWMMDGEGRSLTEWVSVEDGSPLASQPIEGPLWAEGPTLWQWIEESVEVPVWDEEPGETPDPETASGRGTVRRVVLRELIQDVRTVVVEAPLAGGVRQVEHTVRLDGSVGPYLFFTESLYVDAFGAHGSGESRARVWDLRAAAPVEILTDRERASVARGERARAVRRLVAEGTDAGIDEQLEADEVELVTIVPAWDPNEGLRIRYRFATEACYACGDGEWSDYTRSVQVDAAGIPERLAEHAAVPAWVREVAGRHPDRRVAGFTVVEDPAPARALDALHR